MADKLKSTIYNMFQWKELPNELLAIAVGNLSSKDALSLVRTCREMYIRVLPIMYLNDVQDNARSVPLALQWACWSGYLSAAQASLYSMTPDKRLDVLSSKFDPKAFFSRTSDSLRYHYIDRLPVLTTALHVACMRGNTRIALLLLQLGANAEQLDGRGFPALHYALNQYVVSLYYQLPLVLFHFPPVFVRVVQQADSARQARMLLEHGASINSESSRKTNPLTSILEHEAKPARPCLYHVLQDFHYVQAWTAARYDPKESESIGSIEPRHAVPDIRGLVSYLLAKGAVVEPEHHYLYTYHPLKSAVVLGDKAMVKMLLDAGALPHTRCIQSNSHESILALAIREVNRRDKGIQRESRMAICYEILNVKAPIELPPETHMCPMSAALDCATKDDPEWNKLFARVCSRTVDINRPIMPPSLSVKPLSPLKIAFQEGKLHLVKILEKHGAVWGSKGLYLNAKSIEGILRAMK